MQTEICQQVCPSFSEISEKLLTFTKIGERDFILLTLNFKHLIVIHQKDKGIRGQSHRPVFRINRFG